MIANELSALFARDLARLAQELRAFPDSEAIWLTAPGMANPAGTLALHLEGNLREYVGRLLGGVAYQRDRDLEFRAQGLGQQVLVSRIEAMREDIPGIVAALSGTRLDSIYPESLNGGPCSTRQFLIHLAGHLNDHLGQVDVLRRISSAEGGAAAALPGRPRPGSTSAGQEPD